MSFDALLVQKGTLQRAVEVEQPSGFRKPDWLDVATVPCLVNPNARPANLKEGVLENVTHIVFIKYRVDIVDAQRDRWRIIVDGITYEVVEPYNPGGRRHHLELRCRRSDGP